MAEPRSNSHRRRRRGTRPPIAGTAGNAPSRSAPPRAGKSPRNLRLAAGLPDESASSADLDAAALAADNEPLEDDEDDAEPCNCETCTAERAAASSSTPHSELLTPHSPLPVSDSALISALAAGKLDPEQIARQFNIRLDLFLDWMAAPETVKRINMLIQGRAHVKQQQREAARDESLNNLIKLQREALERNDPVEARRTAIGVLRFTSRNSAPLQLFSAGGLPAGAGAGASGGGVLGARAADYALNLSRFPAHYRTRSRHIRTTPLLREPPMILPEPAFPSANDSPAAITINVLQRLQDSDNPMPGDGLRCLYNYFTPAWRNGIGVKTADDFARTDLFGYVQLIGHHSAVLYPTQLPDGHTYGAQPLAATQQAEFIDLDGYRRCVTIKFTRTSNAEPWLIDDIRIDPPPEPGPAPCPCPACSTPPPTPATDPPPDPPPDPDLPPTPP